MFGTALKYRSWPPDGGPTAFAPRDRERAPRRGRVRASVVRLAIAGSSTWTGGTTAANDEYKLIDCNPRIGAQFRLLENDAGIDFALRPPSRADRSQDPSGPPTGRSGIQCRAVRRTCRRRLPPDGAGREPDRSPARTRRTRMAGVGRPASVRGDGRLLARASDRSDQAARAPDVRREIDWLIRRAAKLVPKTNRMTGPKVGAAARPAK